MYRYSKVLSQSGRFLTNTSARKGSAVAYKPVTMNELPAPSGSWQAQYAANQTRYNLHLAGGILFTIFTVFAGVQTGTLYLNHKIPELKKD